VSGVCKKGVLQMDLIQGFLKKEGLTLGEKKTKKKKEEIFF
jgi:hypothetical protein